MFQIKIDTVRELTTNGPTYMKGRQYYRQGLIKHLTFNQEKGIILAQVEGTRIYSVRAILDGNGHLHDASCTCSAFSAYWGLCKHIAAVLLYSIDAFGQDKTHISPVSKPDELLSAPSESKDDDTRDSKTRQQAMRRSRTKTRDFLSHIDHAIQLSQTHNKQPVQLQVILHSSRQASSAPCLTFAVGTDTLHPVTNVEQFAEAVSRDLSLELNKDFTYNPLFHSFPAQDRPIIDLIRDAFEHDYKSVFGTSHTSSRNQTFPLNPGRFADFLRISAGLSDCSWKSARNAKPLRIEICEEPLPIRLTLTPSSGANRKAIPYQLKWACQKSIYQLTASRNIFLVDHVFYLPPADTLRLIEPVLSHFNGPGSHALDLNSHEASWLLSIQDQPLMSFCPFDLHPDLKDEVIQEPLHAMVLLDSIDMALKADIVYQYGPVTINPTQNNEPEDQVLIRRDFDSEKKVLNCLAETGFVQQGQSLRLKDNDAIYQFVSSAYNGLEKIATLQRSAAAEQIVVHPAPDISFSFHWSDQEDGLVLKQDYDGLNPESFERYCQALRENRSFLRERDGSFREVNLDQKDRLLKMVSLLRFWQIDPTHEHILPRYRALSLIPLIGKNASPKHSTSDRPREEHDCVVIDERIKQMIHHLHQPASMACTIPAALKKQLRPYQKTGVQWLYMLYTYGLGGILADDMGLGKTIQTITFIHMLWRRFKKTSLVIAPTSLIYNWVNEFEKFDPKLPVLLIDGNRRQRNSLFTEIGKHACVITSYALLRRDIDAVKDFPFGSCFLDEAQNIKNPETLNARSVKQITTARAFALTGTPLENSLIELWSIFDFVLPGFLHDQRHFQSQYELPIMRDQNVTVLESLHEQVMPFILRRMKKDVLKELPDKIESHTICDMTEEQRDIYDTFLSRSREDLKQEIALNGYARSQIYILALLTRLRQICCHPALFLKQYESGSGKLMLLEELLSDCFSSGHRVLVFSQFTSMLEIIRKNQMQQGIQPFYIDGQISSEDRINQVNRFNDGEGKLFLISLRAGGTGLNLTGADTVIHYDPWWNPAVEEQATDRAYRIGQENIVQVFKLCTRHSVEERILSLQQEKQNLIDAVIKPGQNLLSKMTVEEVLRLFEP